jgi:acyl-CoA reductase-like NAD-dependent aldehyde dehydrogenase
MNNTSTTDLNIIFENQRRFFTSGKTRSVKFRIRQLNQLAKMLLENRRDFLHALKKDLSRHEFETTFGEIEMALQEIRYVKRNLRKWMHPEFVPTAPMHLPGKSFIVKEPYGITLIIAPWNYPVLLLLAPLVGAIAAGNCSVLKPSQTSKNTSALIAQLFLRYFEQDYISVVETNEQQKKELLSLPFDYIFYTGSTYIGKVIMEAAAKNLTPVTLELGGKSPCVVERETSLMRTARRICFGKFFNAGQTCIAPDYVLVQEDARDELIDNIQKVIRKFYGDNPSASSDFARMISEKHFDKITELMKYGKIVSGGITDREKKYISPTVLVDVDPDSPLMKEEIFGPLLPVLTYKTIDQAILFINERPKPLALYLFTRNRSVHRKFIRETSSGGLLINDTLSHFTNGVLPFGGVGPSGMGNYHGKKTFSTFTHEKSVMKKSLSPDWSLRYPPYKKPGKLLRFFIRLMS